jgi:tetratricopeptide (TPR) repeat protein
LLAHKRYDEALAEFRKALTLDPLSGIINTNYGVSFFVARRFDEARQQFEKTAEIDSNFVQRICRSAEFEGYMGNFAVARQQLLACDAKAQKVDLGTTKEAFWQAYVQVFSEHHAQTAFAYAVLGRKDEAFRDIDAALDEVPAVLSAHIQGPMFDNLHSDPRYAAVLRRMKLAP